MKISTDWLDEFRDSIPQAMFEVHIKQTNGHDFAFTTNELGVRMLQFEYAKNQFDSIIYVTDLITKQRAQILEDGRLTSELDSMALGTKTILAIWDLPPIDK